MFVSVLAVFVPVQLSKRMRSVNYYWLLLALIATSSFQGNGSVVVRATDISRPSYGGRVLIRRNEDVSRATTETTEKICGADEQDGTGIKKRYMGQRIDICEWVALKPRRCRKKIKRKGNTFRQEKQKEKESKLKDEVL